jgi:hypothetical protein
MKIKKTLIYSNIAGKHILVPVGEDPKRYSGVFCISDTAARMWELLCRNPDEETVLMMMLNEYDVSRHVLKKDFDEFIGFLRAEGIVEDD